MGRLQSWYHWVFTDRALFLSENKRLRDDNKRLTEAKQQFKDIATELTQLRREQRRARTVMDKMLQQQKEQRYWTRVYEGQLQAILRNLYLDSNELSYPSKLSAQRFRLVSQNEEDGMTWALLSEIGATNRRFIDIGCGLNGGNSGFLARECGWSGLMIDADQRKTDRAARRYGSRVKGVAAWITRDNINELLEKQGVDRDVDLLSIDVDGVDYWIWDALERCSPRLVIIEYNALFGSSRSVVVPYDHNFESYRVSRRPHCLGGWGLWDVQVGFLWKCANVPSGWSRSTGRPTPQRGRCCSRWRRSSAARRRRCGSGCGRRSVMLGIGRA